MPNLKIELNYDFLRKIGESSKFAIKVLNIRILPSFLLKQKENDNSNMFCKYQHHSMQIFFQNGEFYVF